LVRPDFEKILLEAIDEGLSSIGESAKQAIYFHLDRSFNIKKEEIPNRIEAFAGAVESIFGVGADFLEIAIMKQLHEKVGQVSVWHTARNLTFTEYVTANKRGYRKKSKSKARTEIVQCREIAMET